MLVVFLRAIILYLVVFLVIRLMGKRELSQVQPFELCIIVLIADIASGPMASRGMTIFEGIVPIVALLIAYTLFTIVIKASKKAESIVCGTPSLIIKDGVIIESEVKKQQYVIEEIMSQLRANGVFKIQDAAFAILETNGKLSVLPKSQNFSAIPLNVISDGKILDNNLDILSYSKDRLTKDLEANNLRLEDVFLGTIDENSKFIYQLREKESSQNDQSKEGGN